MYPTVNNKEVLLVSKVKKPSQGDIVTIYSDKLGKYLCKRVIGVSGDEIEIRDGIVYRNGKKLVESYNEDTETNGTWKVGANELFVLGDNRNNSTDSRNLGVLQESNLQGVVILKTGITKGVFNIILLILILSLLVLCQSPRKRGRKRNRS